MKRNVTMLVILMSCAFLFLWVRSRSTPPSDSKLIKQFYDHRIDFEKLRTMLREDSKIIEVATYGISTTNRNEIDPLTSEQAGLPKQRYEEYLATLKSAGASLAVHNDFNEFYFLIARWGSAGNGWGIAVISRDSEPTNQVSSLDDFRNIPSREVYRHIEGNWYLWMKDSN
jgi:hypothetical protein